MKIGEKIRNARIAAGYTQYDLANKLYVTQQAVHNWETGKAIPQADRIIEICSLLHTSPTRLMCDIEGRIPDSRMYIDYSHPYIQEIEKLREFQDDMSVMVLAYMEKQIKDNGKMIKEKELSEKEYSVYRAWKEIRPNGSDLDFYRFMFPEEYKELLEEPRRRVKEIIASNGEKTTDNCLIFSVDQPKLSLYKQTKEGVYIMADKDMFYSKLYSQQLLLVSHELVHCDYLKRVHVLNDIVLDTIKRKDEPVVVFDSNGDLYGEIVKNIPEERENDIVLMDIHCMSDYILPYNPLDVRRNGISVEQAVLAVMAAGDALWENHFLEKTQKLLEYTLTAIAAHNESAAEGSAADGLSLVGIFLNADKDGKEKYLNEITDEKTREELKDYFLNNFELCGEHERSQRTMFILSKAYRFEEPPLLENFSAPKSVLDFQDIIENKKVLLVNTGVRYHGKEISGFITQLLLNCILNVLHNMNRGNRCGGSGDTGDTFEKRVLFFVEGAQHTELVPRQYKSDNCAVLCSSAFLDAEKLVSYKLIVNQDNTDELTVADIISMGDPAEAYRFIASGTCSGNDNSERVFELQKNYAVERDAAKNDAWQYLERIKDYGFVAKNESADIDVAAISEMVKMLLG